MLNKAEINLDILQENAFNIKSKLGGANFNAVVKADAYGHGAEVIANALYGIVDSYSVALPEEGVRLRQVGIDKEILVLTPPFYPDCKLYQKYDLTATVCDVQTVFTLAENISNGKIKAHLKVNTGMNRYGCALKQIDKIFAAATKSGKINITGMYSHLRAPEDNMLFKSQLDDFLLAYRAVKGYNNSVLAHLSASGGFLNGAYMDMCRIGLLLYGYKPFKSNAVKVKPIMKVFAPTVTKRKILCGEGLLYGNGVLDTDAAVSIVRFGYADGLPRIKADLPANRCMDCSAYYGLKKCVAVLDGNADELAKKYGTIPYEILCNVSKRAEKVYLR